MKTITKFFVALGFTNTAVKQCADLAFLDLLPQFTTKLDEWFSQFGLRDNGTLTEQQRRDKLDGAWKATGSLSPGYLQGVLQGQGFDVYVHEFWEPGTEPVVGVESCAVVRNPNLYLQQGNVTSFAGADCGEAFMECGEAFAACGNSIPGLGYILVDKVFGSVPNYTTLCGVLAAECGEETAACGNYVGFNPVPNDPVIPTDQSKWPYFAYIGAQTFPDLAVLPAARRDEFEELILKYVRASNWAGVLVTYS